MDSARTTYVSRVFSAIIVLLIISFSLLIANETGPENGRTGAPGESNCTVGCHSSFPLNSGSGSVAISGIPETGYMPGEKYTITISVSQSGQIRWGFEAVILDASNNNAGTITVTDASRTQTSQSGGRTYIKHTLGGTASGTWTFDWTAPASDIGEITIYAAGNAANGNGSNQGDFIYTTSLARNAEVPTSVSEDRFTPYRFELHGNYPNPFNPATTIRYELERPGVVTLRIYDVAGREVRTLINAGQTAGTHSTIWDGKDNSGRLAASGAYIVRLHAGARVASSRMVMIR